MNDVQMRKQTRFAVQIPVMFEADGIRREGTVLNLSLDGCAVGSDHPAGIATYLTLEIALDDGGEPLQVPLAAVRWSDRSTFGVEFIRVRRPEQRRLRAFVEMLQSLALG